MPEALERVWVPTIGCALPPCTRPLVTLAIASIPGAPYPTPSRYAVGWVHLSRATPTIVGVLVTGGATSIVSPPVPPFPGPTWCTLGTVSITSLGQGGHELGNLLPQFCCSFTQVSCYHGPCPHLVPDFLILAFCLVGSNHQLQVGVTTGAIQVPDRIANMLTNPMKEAVLEVLLGLKICHPPRAL